MDLHFDQLIHVPIDRPTITQLKMTIDAENSKSMQQVQSKTVDGGKEIRQPYWTRMKKVKVFFRCNLMGITGNYPSLLAKLS